MPEIPEYVTYANDLVDKVGERFEHTLKETVAEMATKSDLRLVEERVERERQAREEALDREQQAREEAIRRAQDALNILRNDLGAAEADRRTKARRLWTGIWAVLGTVILSASTIIAAVISTHP